jgi:hypothetical protein
MKVRKKILPPRPIPIRECACQCGHRFQPNRVDQVYLNKQHADFAYNNFTRKKKSERRLSQEKILHKNDRILARHMKVNKFNFSAIVHHETLLAEGFNFSYNLGSQEVESGVYYFTYNFMFMLLNTEPQKIKIRRR